MSVEQPTYLQPYARAVKRHGADFRALLWASRRTQEQRFEALVHLCDPSGLAVLDLGCGRADLLEFLIDRDLRPKRYVGIEAVAELARAAEAKRPANARIIRADFVRDPGKIQVGADVIFCSGAFNTIDNDAFYRAIENAFAAARQTLVFNFLSSPELAGVNYLHWHDPRAVMRFCRALCDDVARHDGYIDGDCTIRLWKGPGGR